MKKLFALLIIGLIVGIKQVAAQSVEMADTMRQDGKIYVVIGVIVLIFAVLFAYLFWMERRLSKLEKENSQA